MRGQPLLVGLLLVTLGLPGATAVAAEATTLGSTPATGDTVDPIRLYAPAEAFVGHPIHLAVSVPDPASRAAFLPHQNLRVVVALDDELLFVSDSIHEHDGFHPLTLTVTEPGTLRLWADIGAGDPAPMHNGTSMTTLPQSGVWHDLEVQPAPVSDHYGGLDQAPYRDHYTVVMDRFPLRLERTGHGPHFGANMDFFAPDGRLLMNAWPDVGDYSVWVDFPFAHMTGTMRALTLSTPGASHTTFTETIEATFHNATESTLPLGWPDFVYPDCRDDVGLLIDPLSSTAAGLTFTEHADIRIHLPPRNETIPSPNNQAPQRQLDMTIHPIAAADGSQMVTYKATLDAGNAALTFRTPGPGAYSIFLEGARVPNGCATPFVVRAEPEPLAPGKLAADIAVDGGAATVRLSAERDGTALAHYEFDTRVVKTHTASESGRLVWKGKLHGHGGIASFHISLLEAGDYEVQVFPSPENPGVAPVSADSSRGFVYPFHIEPPSQVVGPTPAEPQTAPGPALLVVPLVVGLGLLLRQRTE